MKKLAIITTHPIQYYAPVFQRLANAKNVSIRVFYTWGEQSLQKFDPGFGKVIQWDLPLLQGYAYQFLQNTAPDPGSHHFKGIRNPDILAQIRAFAPDALLVYGWCWQSHLKVLRYFTGKIPLWFRGDSTLLNPPAGWKRPLRHFFLRWVYRRLDRAFFVGTNNYHYFRAAGLSAAQLVFAPHATDNQRFAADQRERAAKIRQDLGIPAGALVVLFAGKLEAVKNPQLLLQAFLTAGVQNACLLFVGNGPLEAPLWQEAAASQQKARVFFLDFVNQLDMPAVYQACQLFCLPSLSETWGLAVNEAMAARRAVLVSDKVGCAADLVQPGRNGAIFESGNAADLRQKLQALLAEPEKLAQMGEASATIIENWSFDHQVSAILEELKNLRQ